MTLKNKLSSYQKLKQKNALLHEELHIVKKAIVEDDYMKLSEIKIGYEMYMKGNEMIWMGEPSIQKDPNVFNGIIM